MTRVHLGGTLPWASWSWLAVLGAQDEATVCGELLVCGTHMGILDRGEIHLGGRLLRQ